MPLAAYLLVLIVGLLIELLPKEAVIATLRQANNKHLMTAPGGNSESCFPRVSMRLELPPQRFWRETVSLLDVM